MTRHAFAPGLAWLIRNWPIRRFKGTLLHRILIPSLNLPQDGDFLATIDGDVRLRLRYSEAIGKSVAAIGSYEPGELQYLRRTLREGDTVIDAGANVGVFTLIMARAVGQGGTVIAVEPDPHNIDRLRSHLLLNKLTNVSLCECAAGATAGTTTLAPAQDHAFTRTIDASDACSRPRDSVAIPVKTLDDIWIEHGRPRVACLKIDIEGAEVSAIEGAGGLLRTCRPVIMAEANDAIHLQALEDSLRPFGYVRSSPRTFANYNFVFTC